jgi:stage IV sporulation protein FB
MFLNSPSSSRGEWRFHLFDVFVRVHPWFWFTTLFMAGSSDVATVLIWVAVCFVSILLHELGHVVAFRAFGMPADVMLYGFGGLATPRYSRRTGTFADTMISLAGPFAGFCLGALTAGIAIIIGAKLHFTVHYLVIPSVTALINQAFTDESGAMRGYYISLVLNDLLFVNIFWGLVNLLPIYPLDGGQAARALFTGHDPLRGRRRSLIISVVAAVGMAIVGLLTRSLYMVALFGILAAGSAQALEAEPKVFRVRQS